ncbi:MAG: OmpA/MotB domain-containing protein [Bacteroidetes bacterium]|nr:MAG: OmpA/MotB domain-containing protein [Bacteroidota bacterium]
MRRIFLFLLLAASSASAQDFLGYSHSNYAGIVGAAYNPASIADHRYSMDILLCGASIELGNNYAGFRRSTFMSGSMTSADLVLRDRPFRKSVFFRNEILLPGIMFSNEKMGWGVDLRVRTYMNVDGVEPNLAHLLVYGLDDPSQYNIEQHNRHVGLNFMSWAELAGTYAKVTFKGAEHFVSAGIRPKFLLGLGSAYAYVNDLDYVYHNDSTLTIFEAQAKFGHSSNFQFTDSYAMSYKVGFNPGVGLDAGIVYENRPDILQNDKTSRKPKAWPGFRERPEYLYRVGISLTDLGFIYFNHGELSDEYAVNASL